MDGVRGVMASALIAAALSGCAGSGNEKEQGPPNDCVPPDPPTISYAANIQPIYDVSCALAGCHLGGAPTGGLNLATGVSWENTVDVKSIGRPKLDLVEPGNPEDSYLVRKIEGGPDIAGQLMPPGCGAPGTGGTGDNGAICLSNDDNAAIRQWISECALDN